ncbi:MAG: LytTR family transcriptional regulator DNA-binding domain-containing protein [Draconibacterium sp.]|nr:LytTR family transcriptional regulator DNA-binding domain-containing protein [Draconibacterium sp.]
MVHGTIKDLMTQLPENRFERIYKSYAISLSKVIYVEGNMVKIADHKLSVSQSYKEQLLIKLG